MPNVSTPSTKFVIVDVDGTIADVRHRLHHIQGSAKKNWKTFFESMDHDRPIPEMVQRVRDLSSDFRILIVTGRPEQYRARTEAWLKKHGIPYERIFMRRDGDHRPDYVAKRAVLDEIDPKDVVLAIDDRAPVCQMWQKHGIPCEFVQSDVENQEVNEIYRKKT